MHRVISSFLYGLWINALTFNNDLSITRSRCHRINCRYVKFLKSIRPPLLVILFIFLLTLWKTFLNPIPQLTGVLLKNNNIKVLNNVVIYLYHILLLLRLMKFRSRSTKKSPNLEKSRQLLKKFRLRRAFSFPKAIWRLLATSVKLFGDMF